MMEKVKRIKMVSTDLSTFNSLLKDQTSMIIQNGEWPGFEYPGYEVIVEGNAEKVKFLSSIDFTDIDAADSQAQAVEVELITYVVTGESNEIR